MASKYHNQPTHMLLKKLEQITETTAKSIKLAAEILLELRRREESHPLMQEGILRWYLPIADGTLSPRAAMAFAGLGSIIRKLIGVPTVTQDNLANGKTLTVAEHNTAGEIVAVEKKLMNLTMRELDLVFESGTVRTFQAQKAILAVRGKETRVHRSNVTTVLIKADVVSGELVWGQMRCLPSQLVGPLMELGYKPLEKAEVTQSGRRQAK